jgi:hypothetical protein
MRHLDGHKVNPANDLLMVTVHDQPGSGGACHEYSIAGPNFSVPISFQNGPINEVGVNGITHEALLTILIDRLEGFQAGPFANECNARALSYLEAAQGELFARTRERMARGVEGTHKV